MPQPPSDFTVIYRTYARDVLRFALYLCGDRAEAEDIVSDTFVAAWTTPTTIAVHADSAPSPATAVEDRIALDAVSAKIAQLPEIERTARV